MRGLGTERRKDVEGIQRGGMESCVCRDEVAAKIREEKGSTRASDEAIKFLPPQNKKTKSLRLRYSSCHEASDLAAVIVEDG